MRLSGWGRHPVIDCAVDPLRKWRDLQGLVDRPGTLIARGNGRAYGDAALNLNLTVSMLGMDRLQAFDPAIRWRWTFRSVLAQPNCWTPWTRSPTHTVGACIWRRTRSAGRRDCAWDILAFRHYGTAPCRPSVTAAANAQARLRLHPRPTKANSHATRGGLPFRSADCRNYCRWRARHDRTKIARWRPTQGRLPRTARLRRPARPCYGS